uniref:Ig-like domain-containing protein n=1 Tax=Callorhinchus milii TaxID=7868 RepID=A0A4W3GRX9_CALMI
VSFLFLSIVCLNDWLFILFFLERAPKPTLTVDPPSGPVTLGGNVTFTCTAPQHTPGMRFKLYKDDAVSSQITGPVHVPEAVFQITGITSQNDGRYHCVYDIPSSVSDRQRVSQTNSCPSPPTRSRVLGSG